jgi:hypothetical protein
MVVRRKAYFCRPSALPGMIVFIYIYFLLPLWVVVRVLTKCSA